MKVKPLGDKLLITRIASEDKTPGGLIIPDSAKEKANRAKVIAVGPGKWVEGKRQPVDVKAGDTVLIGKWVGSELKLGGEEYLIISEDEVLAVEER